MNVYTLFTTRGESRRSGRVNSSTLISLYLLVLICLILSCNNSGLNHSPYEGLVCGEEDPDRSAIDITGAVTDSDIALKRANSRENPSFVVERVSESELTSVFLKDYNIFHAWGPFGHLQNITVVVGPDGCSAILPDEFNGLVRDAGFILRSEEEAEELLKFYLNLYEALPGTDDIRIVERPDEIPGVADTSRYSEAIESQEIETAEEGWKFQFLTWQLVSGNLDSWSVEMSNKGEVDILEKERLATQLGDYVTIE